MSLAPSESGKQMASKPILSKEKGATIPRNSFSESWWAGKDSNLRTLT
jgi:hypothetical protein